MSKEYLIGIDPGETGAAVALSVGDGDLKWSMIKSHPSPVQFLNWIGDLKGDVVQVWIEELGGRPGDTPNTAFVLGTSYGIWQMLGRAICDHEFHRIKPQLWQTRFARLMTQGKVRYCPGQKKDRKDFIWRQVQKVMPTIPKYAADAAAIAILQAHRYNSESKGE